MRPLMARLPRPKRNLYFAIGAPVMTLVLFFILGLILTGVTVEYGLLLALLFAPIFGIGGAWALWGWPHVTTKDGKPLIEPKYRPFLFFPLFLAFSFGAYVILGVFLTPVLPPALLAYVSLGVAMVFAGVVSYFLVGFPHLVRFARDQWARVPKDRRPYLFFPIAAALTLLLFFVGGLAITPTSVPLQVQPLIVLPLALVLACVAAYFLVGIPKPAKPVKEYVPEVPGRRRPMAFFLTFLLAGLPLAYLAGLSLTFGTPLPESALLPIAILLGFACSLGLAALAWGTPRRWKRYADYKPGVPEGMRVALFVPIVLACGLVGAIVAYAANLEMFWGILAGVAIGLLIALPASGATTKLRAFGREPLPDMVKPLVLFPVWLLVGGLAFVIATYSVPEFFVWNLMGAVVLGLVVAVLAVERETIVEWNADRREARERAAERRRRRKEALASLAKAPREKDA